LGIFSWVIIYNLRFGWKDSWCSFDVIQGMAGRNMAKVYTGCTSW
jgi:hypothetical protein